VIPTPIHRDGLVYFTSGYGVGCRLIELGPGQEVHEVYSNKNMKNQHGGVVLVGAHLYGYSDGQGWVCQDFRTGTIKWSEKSELGKGCLTYADGMLYCLEERRGEVALVEASPDGWSQRGRFRLEPTTELRKPKGGIWTHPVVAGGRLYLRDQELLHCYDVRVP
jgi:outer membrane protein assembly factor BamB